MGKKKRKNFIGRWLVTILNTAICIMIIKQVYMGHILIQSINISYLSAAGYFLVSTLLIKLVFAGKLRKLYLNCSMEEVDEMTGIEFEYFLYYKFRQLGYKVKTTPVTGDYGADLILKKRKEKIVVQAKRYHRDVGIAAVQEVIGSIGFYNADRGMVITNSFFTPNAVNLARANEVTLWDRKMVLRELMNNHISEETYENPEAEKERVRFCPLCGKKLVYRNGRYGYFLGCSGYPKCSYTASLSKDEFK